MVRESVHVLDSIDRCDRDADQCGQVRFFQAVGPSTLPEFAPQPLPIEHDPFCCMHAYYGRVRRRKLHTRKTLLDKLHTCI